MFNNLSCTHSHVPFLDPFLILLHCHASCLIIYFILFSYQQSCFPSIRYSYSHAYLLTSMLLGLHYRCRTRICIQESNLKTIYVKNEDTQQGHNHQGSKLESGNRDTHFILPTTFLLNINQSILRLQFYFYRNY